MKQILSLERGDMKSEIAVSSFHGFVPCFATRAMTFHIQNEE